MAHIRQKSEEQRRFKKRFSIFIRCWGGFCGLVIGSWNGGFWQALWMTPLGFFGAWLFIWILDHDIWEQ